MLAKSEACRDDQMSMPNAGLTAHPEKQKAHSQGGTKHEAGTLSKPSHGELSAESASNLKRKLGFDETHQELK